MQVFFYICEYLEVTPNGFFDMDTPNPVRLNDAIAELNNLSDSQLSAIINVAKEMNPPK
jgi:hypothetical protein